MKILKLFNFAVRFGRMLSNVSNVLLVGLGAALLSGALFVAAVVHEKDLAVAIAIISTFFGTALLSLFLPKLIYSAMADRLEHEVSASKEWKRCQEMEREITRLQSMRLNVEAFQPIAKLGLLEVETVLTDFLRTIEGDEIPEKWYRKGRRDIYLGVLRIPLKACLGVDLQKVRVQEMHDGRLAVSGITMITIIDTAEGATWLLDEVRTEYLKGDECVKFEGDAGNTRSKEYSREQEKHLRVRLKAGQDFKVFEAGLVHMVEQILRLLLSPLGKEIVFDSTSGSGTSDLLTFLNEHNRQVQARISALKAKDEFDGELICKQPGKELQGALTQLAEKLLGSSAENKEKAGPGTGDNEGAQTTA